MRRRSLLLDVPFDSAAEFDFVRALIASRRRRCSSPCRSATSRRSIDLNRSGCKPEVLEQKGDDRSRRAEALPVRQQAAARARADRRRAAVLGAGRRPRVRRDCAPHSRGSARRRGLSTRWRCSCGRRSATPVCSSTRSSARAFPRGSIAARAGRIRRAAPSSRSSPARARSSRRAGLPSTSRSRRCRSSTASAREFDVHRSGRRGVAGAGSAAQRIDGDESDEARSALEAAGSDRRRDRGDDDAVVAGSLRAPWKWETLIVESAVIGGDPARWHRRLAGLAQRVSPEDPGGAQRGSRSPRAARLERDLRTSATCARSRCRSSTCWPRGRRSATWGEWLDRFAALAPDGAAPARARAARARGAAADGRDRPGLARRSARRHRRSAADARGRSAAPSLRARLRRQPAAGARPHVPRRVRRRPGRADVSAEAARRSDAARRGDARAARCRAGRPGGSRGRTERLLLRLAVGAPTERLWLSYPRIEIAESRPRVPSFYALDVMRAITGRIPHHEELQERAASRGRRDAGVAGAGRSRRERSTISSTTSPCFASCCSPTNREGGPRPRALPAAAERCAEAIGDDAVGARARSSWTPFDGITRVTGMTGAAARRPAAGARVRIRCRRCRSSRPVRISSCCRRSTGSSRRGPEPLQKLDPLTRGALFHEVQAEFFRDAARRRRRCRSRTATATTRWRCSIAIVATRVGRVPRTARAGDRPRLARRDRRHRARPARLGATAAAARRLDARVLRVRFRLARRRARSAQRARARARRRPLPAARLGRSDRAEAATVGSCASPITRRARTGRRGRRSSAAARCCSRCSYSLAVEQALDTPVTSGRLFYCTSAGGFADHEIPINDANRAGRARGARDHRSRHRARLPAGGARRARVHLVRLPPGVRTRRGAARRA